MIRGNRAVGPNKRTVANRWWICGLIVLGSASLLIPILALPAQAIPHDWPPPAWRSFPLITNSNIGQHAEVFEHYILWSELDYTQYGRPSCDLTNGSAAHSIPSKSAISRQPAVVFPSAEEIRRGYLAVNGDAGPLLSLPNFWPQAPTSPPIDFDICLYDGRTGLVDHLLPTNEGWQDMLPHMYGDWVVFQRDVVEPRLVLYNLITGELRFFPPDYWIQRPQNPSIYGDLVVYRSEWGISGLDRISAYNLTSGQYFTISLAPRPFYYENWPDIYDQTVVWLRSISNDPFDWDVIGYDLTSQTPFTISARPGDEGIPQVDGDLVVWHWNDDIYGYDLSTGQYLTITNDPHRQIFPDVYQNLVVWSDDRNGRWDVYGRDLESGETYWITQDNPLPQSYYPDVWGNVVAWDSYYDGAAAARKMTEFRFLPLLNGP
jgi:beta propeller repeat protein